ncbi:MAG: long-chain-fatty-acid--CoA ligase [Pseudomonadota bacterium]
MRGLMQDFKLSVASILNHCELNHANVPVVSLTPEGKTFRGNYGLCLKRAKQLAQALTALGVEPGDRVATLGWNTHRHLECWYAATGMGAIIHTVNPRLFADQITYIINHAEDKVLLFDITFAPIIENIASALTSTKVFVAMTDEAHCPNIGGLEVLAYESLIAEQSGDYSWPDVEDENAAVGLCYTSGTTGNPKGVLYSHRSTVLHTYAACMADTLAVSATDTMLPVVPMFHANAWGVPYATSVTGAKLVLNGPHFDGDTLLKLLNDERITITAAVPTVWLGLLQHLEKTGAKLPHLKRVTIGGSAAPRSMIEAFETKYDVQVNHAWGMTELSPLGSVGSVNHALKDAPHDTVLDVKAKQGRSIYGVEMKIVDEAGNELPRDGKSYGNLLVRGPWIAGEYFKSEGGSILDKDGWFDTGDVAIIDPLGFLQITDRAKDVIKSGGEWISSIDLENAAVGHPAVAEAAVIGVAHPKWDERPLLVIVKKDGMTVSKADILEFLTPKVAKWWLPDDVAFVDDIPHTATGKIQKLRLREQFKDYVLPTAVAEVAS